MDGQYGIVANVVGVDRFIRKNSKAWLIGGTGGEGYYRFMWICRCRNGHLTMKWMPTKRMGNFRKAWIPDHIRSAANGELFMMGTKAEMQERAIRLNEFAEELRNND